MLKKFMLTGLTLCLLFSGLNITASAGENTTYTYTVSVSDEWIRTQDAYMSGRVYLKGSGLLNPKDIFYSKGSLYVADSGNGRIVVMDIGSEDIYYIGDDVLIAPSGIFVDGSGTVYAADPQLKAIVIFAPDGSETGRIERPDSFLFGKDSKFEPKNVVVTSQGNIFVAGYGSYSGLMRFDKTRVFQGFFAPNKRGLTVLETIQELIFTERQKEQMVERIPRAIENIDLADRDMIYSVTQGEYTPGSLYNGNKSQNYLKLHNMGSLNILSDDTMVEEWNFTDVAKGNDGNVYALTSTGLIYEYDSAGNLIFSFGGRAVSSDRAGLFTVAAAIDTDEDGIIYVLDEERGFVQTFYPTQFALITHSAINELESGNYKSSEEIWESLLRLNGNSSIAHLGYGKALLRQGRYSEAMQHFKICGDKEYDSQAFWEIRSDWLNRNAGYIIIAVIITAAAVFFRKKIIKKRVKRSVRRLAEFKGAGGDIIYIFNMLRHPIDSYYEIKHRRRGSIAAATFIYILLFAVFIADLLFRGYLFSKLSINDIPFFSIPLMFFIPLVLWLFGNNMIASINDGEGDFRSIYISSAYMTAPYLVLAPPAIIMTYLLSLNEAFLVNIVWLTGLIWTGVLLFMSVVEIHNYSFGQAVKNLLLILFFMIMAVVSIAIIYLVWTQVFGYLSDVFGEAAYRIFG